MDRLTVSPCSNPEMELEDVLRAYSGLGFSAMEVFVSWAKSAFDIGADPAHYLALGRRYGMAFTSFHLPPITDDFQASLASVLAAARFAKAVGAEIVIYKASSRDNYVRGSKAILDVAESLGLMAVLQNHAGSPIATLDDYRAVRQAVADHRLKSLLEVGHFHTAGVHWRDGMELLGDSIALVHLKDQIGGRSVPFGTGEIDLPGLLDCLASTGYLGRYVIEMEVQDRPNTLTYLGQALHYVRNLRGDL